MKNRRKRGVESIKSRTGFMFVLPWIFGIIVFVIVPLFSFLYFGFAEVTLTQDGLNYTFEGLKFYKQLFNEDAYYFNYFTESLFALFKSVPIVVALSMILAIILNQNFKGRLLARATFFLPVIIASGVVMNVISGFDMAGNFSASAGLSGAENTSEYMEVINFAAILEQLNLPGGMGKLISEYLNDTFNLIWSCGVQILLFVAGLQTIPAQLYEVGKVEGITPVEEFFYITVPMLGRVIMLVIFYSMVELFVDKSTIVDNALVQMEELNYSVSSAMLWPYFVTVGLIIGIVIFLYNHFCLKKWE